MYNLNNITLITSSYACDKACPFCIAKNNKKFNGRLDDIGKISENLYKLQQAGFYFERFVLSGNGEPSLYSYEYLSKLAFVLMEHRDLFNKLRIQTSGNIFFEDDKFRLFDNLFRDIEISFSRVSINSHIDMSNMGYARDYTQSVLFNNAKDLKMDIGLTKILNIDSFSQELDNMLQTYPNINVVRFKELMVGENEDSIQAKWIRDNKLPREEVIRLATKLNSYYQCNGSIEFETSRGTKIKFERTGNYDKDIVLNNGEIQDYEQNSLVVNELIKKSNIEDEDLNILRV
ncbi:MAG: hypothetical protein FWF46_08040 [Oscillospiraceae bacterium]|nr:hypothetical protein [Oscillospiraceae bacterium]